MKIRSHLFAAMVIVWVSATAPQAQQAPELLTEYDRARAAMVADPGNPETAFVFAERAVAVGDVRGAIDALERVLTLNPDLTNIRFELGLLYLRAGSPDLAESYLRDVLDDPGTPAEIRQRSESLLADADAARARTRVDGSLAAGIEYDSNANAAPGGLLVGGTPFEPAPQDRARSDVSAVVSGRLRHSHDLGGQFGPFVETGLTLFSRTNRDVSASDVVFLGVDSGPRVRLGPEGRHSLRPYIGATTLMLGGSHYANAGTVGLDYGLAFEDGSLLSAAVASRWQTTFASEVNPTAGRFEGRTLTARLGYRRALTDGLALDAGIAFSDAALEAAFESRRTAGLDVTLSQTIANVLNDTLDPGMLTLSAGYTVAEYDAPNPEIDPGSVQRDDRWQIGLGAVMPLSEDWALDAGVTYTRNDSTLPNDAYDSLQVSLSLRYTFGMVR